MTTIAHGLDEITALYGDCAHVIAGTPGELAWRQSILVPLTLPSPLTLPGGLTQIHMQVHRLVFDDLNAILAECWPFVKSIGCYAFRKSRTTDRLSTHCWGVACDINAETNQLGTPGDMDPAVVTAFGARNWMWGGHFPERDAMHFQAATGW